MKKFLVYLTVTSWTVAALILVFSDELKAELFELKYGESYIAALRWIFGLSIVFGTGIPFLVWLISISNWAEKMIEDSVIYGKKDE